MVKKPGGAISRRASLASRLSTLIGSSFFAAVVPRHLLRARCLILQVRRRRPDRRGADIDAPAGQEPGVHRSLALEVDGAPFLEPERLAQSPSSGPRDLHPPSHAVGFHAAGDVHGVTPQVIDELALAYDAGHSRASV